MTPVRCSLNAEAAESIARMALAGLHREYPNQVALVLSSGADARPPRELTPAFFGCYDWHSAVHSHWCLVRLARCFPEASWAGAAIGAVSESLTKSNLSAELSYLSGSGREGFERPYGLAWLLQLSAELLEWDDSTANAWNRNLAPLVELAISRMSRWLDRLQFPIRSGEHSQSAFAMGLSLDYASASSDGEFAALIERRALDFHFDDVDGPLYYEPSGHDFLSPCLAEADLMRRVLAENEFSSWLRSFLPVLQVTDDFLDPIDTPDCSDGKIAHLVGLNLSRAWMLDGIGNGLADDDRRRTALLKAASQHRHAGLSAIAADNYALSHWIGSFAVYLTTERGRKRSHVPPSRAESC